MSLHKAIRSIHSDVVTISGNTKEDIVALDSNGDEVTVNWSSVESWTDPEEYKILRASEYPSIVDQLDDIYHNGIDGWKTTIKATKDKYPK